MNSKHIIFASTLLGLTALCAQTTSQAQTSPNFVKFYELRSGTKCLTATSTRGLALAACDLANNRQKWKYIAYSGTTSSVKLNNAYWTNWCLQYPAPFDSGLKLMLVANCADSTTEDLQLSFVRLTSGGTGLNAMQATLENSSNPLSPMCFRRDVVVEADPCLFPDTQKWEFRQR